MDSCPTTGLSSRLLRRKRARFGAQLRTALEQRPQDATTIAILIIRRARRSNRGEIFRGKFGRVGLLSIPFRLEKTAYRYASITLTIIVLIPRLEAPWAIAWHRFIEVSVGIIVALAVVALWPEHRPPSSGSTAE